MKKILVLVILIGVFYGCASREESMLEVLNSYKGSGKDTIMIKGLVVDEIEVNLKEFFLLSKEQQAIKAEEIQKEVDEEARKYYAKRGVYYDINDSKEEISRKITEYELKKLTRGMPPEIRKRILDGNKNN